LRGGSGDYIASNARDCRTSLKPGRDRRTIRVSQSRKEDLMAKAKSPVPDGFHTVTPHLIFDNAAQAMDWYKQALGAEEKTRALGPDGKVIHGELQIGNSRIMLNDAMGGGRSAKAFGGSPIALWVYVPDCDTMFNRAVAAGAQVAPGPMGQLSDQFWGDRSGTFTDPFGFQWTVATRKEDLSKEEMDRRAKEFFKQQPTHA
jgi:PhnB protein